MYIHKKKNLPQGWNVNDFLVFCFKECPILCTHLLSPLLQNVVIKTWIYEPRHLITSLRGELDTAVCNKVCQ
jgi:hypothetical protein